MGCNGKQWIGGTRRYVRDSQHACEQRGAEERLHDSLGGHEGRGRLHRGIPGLACTQPPCQHQQTKELKSARSQPAYSCAQITLPILNAKRKCRSRCCPPPPTGLLQDLCKALV